MRRLAHQVSDYAGPPKVPRGEHRREVYHKGFPSTHTFLLVAARTTTSTNTFTPHS